MKWLPIFLLIVSEQKTGLIYEPFYALVDRFWNRNNKILSFNNYKQEIKLNTQHYINLFMGEGVRGGVLGVILEDLKTNPGSSFSSFSGAFIGTASTLCCIVFH